MALAALMILGIGIRLYDLTDPPLDFHETRQLGSAIAARGMYFSMMPSAPETERQAAIALGNGVPVYEPRFLEGLVALTYLVVGDEHLWIGRIYSAAVWVIGALFVYSLARKASTPIGGLVAAGFYLFLPYGIIASRSFQPDPLMTVLIVAGILAIYRWCEGPSVRRAALAGGICCAGILTKAVALFPLLGAMVAAAIVAVGVKHAIKNRQVWLMLSFALFPSAIYYLLLTRPGSSGLFSFWVLSLRDLVTQPFFYFRWVQHINYVVGFGWLIPALLGTLLLRGRVGRPLMVVAWLGYLAYGLALPFQIMTHDYYHLMVVPMAAIGLAPLADHAAATLFHDRQLWSIAAIGVAAFASAYFLWDARVSLARDDYRLEAAGWRRLGERVPRDGGIVALTHSYGMRLRYFAQLSTRIWPETADIDLAALAGGGEFDFAEEFKVRTDGARYFLITNFVEFERQPQLTEHLYRNFGISNEGEGYVMFDLKQHREGD